jgi:hypothetical protein
VYIMLDYSIKGPLAPSISLGFYGWTDRGGPLAWYRADVLGSISLGHAFSSAARNSSHLPCCLLSTHMARSRGHNLHAGRGMLDYSIRDPLAPSILLGFYD